MALRKRLLPKGRYRESYQRTSPRTANRSHQLQQLLGQSVPRLADGSRLRPDAGVTTACRAYRLLTRTGVDAAGTSLETRGSGAVFGPPCPASPARFFSLPANLPQSSSRSRRYVRLAEPRKHPVSTNPQVAAQDAGTSVLVISRLPALRPP